MIEQALYIAIGFLAAALAALAAAPLLSRRAMRLAVQRARLRAPVTEKQAAADLDALRAQHAVEQARVEHRLELSEAASNTLRVAVGRQSAEIIRLRSEITDLDGALYDERAKAEGLAAEARELRATVGANAIGLADAFVQRDRAALAANAAETRARELDAETSRQRARTAVLAARAEYLEGRIEDITRTAKAARALSDASAASLEAERGRAAALEARLAATARDNRSLTDRAARFEAERRELGERRAALEERLRTSERAREETLLENGHQLVALADLKAALTAASTRAAGLETRLASATAEARARENAMSLRSETLAAAQAASEGSLKAARTEREALKRENEALKGRIAAAGASSREADAELRNSIVRLGHEVSRLYFAQKSAENRDGQTPDARAPGGAPAAALAAPESEMIGFPDGARLRAGRSLSPDR